MYQFIVVVGALVFLMFVAYRGFSVILFAPVAALAAVLLTDPIQLPPMYTSLFMDKMVGFVKLYFPVFLLGAVFGKVIELSGFSKSIVSSVIKVVGRERAMLSIVVVCAILTYGGVSLFVVVFAVYPFAAEMFKQGGIPKRLIPGTIALGAFTFTMDSLPGTPQIQNIIPTTFFKTNTWAAPWLGVIGGVFILIVGLTYLNWRRKQAQAKGEGYGEGHTNEPEPFGEEALPNPLISILPLVLVGVLNLVFTEWIPKAYGKSHEMTLAGASKPIVTEVSKVAAIWAVPRDRHRRARDRRGARFPADASRRVELQPRRIGRRSERTRRAALRGAPSARRSAQEPGSRRAPVARAGARRLPGS